MLIDYIYFILIIVLICFILFLIYLSYEYRIESFTIPILNTTLNNNQNIATNLKTKLINNYKNYYTNYYNKEIDNQNNKLVDIYNNNLLNVNNSNNLANIYLGIQPIPSLYPSNKPIKTIKSNYNSQYLSVFKNDLNNYGILANDKCLTVNGLCKGEFCLLDCQNKLYTSKSQEFTTNRINSVIDAAKIMNVDYSKINSSNIYPFSIFRPMSNPTKCLKMSNDGILIDKCNLNDKKQQWGISPDDNICYLS